jgi:hypothetical protein
MIGSLGSASLQQEKVKCIPHGQRADTTRVPSWRHLVNLPVTGKVDECLKERLGHFQGPLARLMPREG